MKREIKFRAWDKKENRMILDDSWYFSETFQPFVQSVKQCLNAGFVIMQYAGLKDKNGKEIYEGDIVIVNGYGIDNLKQVVDWDDTVARFSMNIYESDVFEHSSRSIEIIGNIYEHPELLK